MTAPSCVVLVGLRGTGKSTLGAALAAASGRIFVDTDARLAARVGMPAGAYLASHGEAEFRRVEEDVVLTALASADPVVVALGGGAVTIPAVRAALRRPGTFTVLLDAPNDVLVARIAAGAELRPPLTDATPSAEVEALRARRADWYREVAADRLETFPANVDACVRALLAKIGSASRGS